jgi:predicted DNA-binding transcriptional regulator YafY
VNEAIVQAIDRKRLVEFVYRAGRARVVEPHDYVIRHDVERLLGFQVDGESRSGAARGWKEFEVDQIRKSRLNLGPLSYRDGEIRRSGRTL